MTVTNQFKITKVMSVKSRRSNLSHNSTKMVLCQFCPALWLVQTQFMAIFVTLVGLTIAATPALAFSVKSDNLIKNPSVNPLRDNHTSLNLELPLNLVQIQPSDFETQRILAGKYTSGNQVSQLLQKAQSNIEAMIQASEVSNETIDGKTVYKYHFNDTNRTKETPTYTTTWKAPASPPKRRIPEPSTILGLIAIASLFVTQRLQQKKSPC